MYPVATDNCNDMSGLTELPKESNEDELKTMCEEFKPDAVSKNMINNRESDLINLK